jgi:hypothetical protein
MFVRLAKFFIILLIFYLLRNYLISEKILMIVLGTIIFVALSIILKVKVNILELAGIIAFALILELILRLISNNNNFNYASPIVTVYGWYLVLKAN